MSKKKLQNQSEPLISKRVQYDLAVFFTHHPPKTINRHLRNVMLDYLATHPEGCDFDFDSALHSIRSLMKVIDSAEDELVPRTFDEIFEIARSGKYLRNSQEF